MTGKREPWLPRVTIALGVQGAPLSVTPIFRGDRNCVLYRLGRATASGGSPYVGEVCGGWRLLGHSLPAAARLAA